MTQDEHPFIKMVTNHTALIDKICRSFCGENIEDNEDLRQDIILNLWRGWKRWKPNHKPTTWNRSQNWTYAPLYQSYNSHHSDSLFITLGISWRFGKAELEWQAHKGTSED